jgi:hypothetical protein
MLNHFERERMIWAANVPANEKLLLLALNSFVGADGECYPGLERLASMTGFTERTCRTIRDKLKAKEIIETGRRYTESGHRTSDRYRLNFQALTLPENPSTTLPENSSTKAATLPENDDSLPEEFSTHTGNPRQFLPEKFSRDLSSKNYPVRTIQFELEERPENFASQQPFIPVQPGSDLDPPKGVRPPRAVVDRQAAQFMDRPWRDAMGKTSREFQEFVGKAITFGDSEDMHPRTKGLAHINKLDRSGDPYDYERMEAYWEDYQEAQTRAPIAERKELSLAEIQQRIQAELGGVA